MAPNQGHLGGTHVEREDKTTTLIRGTGFNYKNKVGNHVDGEDKGVTEMMTPGGKQSLTMWTRRTER